MDDFAGQFAMSSANAAEVLALTKAQFNTLINRDGAFAELRHGPGLPFIFTPSDLLDGLAIRALMDFGLSNSISSEIVRYNRGLYHALVYSKSQSEAMHCAPVFNENRQVIRWRAANFNVDRIFISLSLWPLFDQLVERIQPIVEKSSEESKSDFIIWLKRMRGIRLKLPAGVKNAASIN